MKRDPWWWLSVALGVGIVVVLYAAVSLLVGPFPQ